jgi:hypothetical protein
MQVAVWVGASVVVCAVIIAYRYLPARAPHVLQEDTELAAETKEELATLDDLYT